MKISALDHCRINQENRRDVRTFDDNSCHSSSDDFSDFYEDLHELLERAQQNRHRRQQQRRLFPAAAFRETSWDIILACFIAELEGHPPCVKQLHADLDESNTAMLRRLAELEMLGMISRSRDDVDGRRTIIRLTPTTRQRMRHYLVSGAPGPG